MKQGLHKNAIGKTPWNKGKKIGPSDPESNKKRSETLKERYKTEIHPRKGKGNWLSGTKGNNNFVPWNKGKQANKIPCPRCGKEVDSLNMKRWHGDNCKS